MAAGAKGGAGAGAGAQASALTVARESAHMAAGPASVAFRVSVAGWATCWACPRRTRSSGR